MFIQLILISLTSVCYLFFMLTNVTGIIFSWQKKSMLPSLHSMLAFGHPLLPRTLGLHLPLPNHPAKEAVNWRLRVFPVVQQQGFPSSCLQLESVEACWLRMWSWSVGEPACFNIRDRASNFIATVPWGLMPR